MSSKPISFTERLMNDDAVLSVGGGPSDMSIPTHKVENLARSGTQIIFRMDSGSTHTMEFYDEDEAKAIYGQLSMAHRRYWGQR